MVATSCADSTSQMSTFASPGASSAIDRAAAIAAGPGRRWCDDGTPRDGDRGLTEGPDHVRLGRIADVDDVDVGVGDRRADELGKGGTSDMSVQTSGAGLQASGRDGRRLDEDPVVVDLVAIDCTVHHSGLDRGPR